MSFTFEFTCKKCTKTFLHTRETMKGASKKWCPDCNPRKLKIKLVAVNPEVK